MQRTDFTALSRLSADIDLMAEGKATGFVRVPHSVHRSAYGWIPIPIVRIKNGDGPSVLMQAGNHGDEWEGQIGLGNLIRALQPKDIKGRLVILPSANFPAAMEGRRTSPIDEGNLNRSFPGDAEGTITQQIAYFIEHCAAAGLRLQLRLPLRRQLADLHPECPGGALRGPRTHEEGFGHAEGLRRAGELRRGQLVGAAARPSPRPRSARA